MALALLAPGRAAAMALLLAVVALLALVVALLALVALLLAVLVGKGSHPSRPQDHRA